ncbi:MAG TPA: tyrosine-type recombinase/integrase [Candidatus Limnocylindrales bacterium]|nr:tyrosine-type recombinase/integrase [Candidatus Limnocylindrales bacterium]
MRFELGTPYHEIERERERIRVELHEEQPIVRPGSFAADVARYLERAKKRPASWKSKRSEMRAWIAQFQDKRRGTIRPEDIDRAIATWRAAGVSLKTIQNRCRTLHHFFVTLANNKKARTPLDHIDVPVPPKRKPTFVDVATIQRVEQQLRTGDPLFHAVYMVIASTGLRLSQVNRLLPTLTRDDVDAGVVTLEGGKGGEAIPIVLNSDQRAAFEALLRTRRPFPTVGPIRYTTIDATAFARAVRAAGWPAGVRPYNARHAVGIELAERGAEDADIQAQLGHSDLSLVRKHYTGIRLSKMRRISELLEGRLGWGHGSSSGSSSDDHKSPKAPENDKTADATLDAAPRSDRRIS